MNLVADMEKSLQSDCNDIWYSNTIANELLSLKDVVRKKAIYVSKWAVLLLTHEWIMIMCYVVLYNTLTLSRINSIIVEMKSSS